MESAGLNLETSKSHMHTEFSVFTTSPLRYCTDIP